ncbi:uncharacterized protein BDV17DRAFT_289646 [Aspergillus undulatus]|uniref:uncharacterized protein n=1 Tax=Aspergillus undulatus TaxID=1810928 RepID=UPI003CCD5DF6
MPPTSKMIACDYPGCAAQYRRKEHLTRHARKHYPTAARLTCEVCNKSFDRTDSLRRHRLLHARAGEEAPPRTSRACDQCHSSKTRCDGGTPCNVCSSRRGGACTFDRFSKRAGGRGRSPKPSTRTGDIRRALETHRLNAEGISDGSSEIAGSNRHDPNFQRTEMEDLMLQHERQLREQGLLNSAGAPTTGEAPAGGNADLDIDHYVEVYFSHFHYQWPMLHSRAFRLSKEPQILLLAVVMIGLWVTGESTAQARAETMHEKLITLLENRMENWNINQEFSGKAWPFTTYQTVTLNIIFAVTRKVSATLYTRTRTLLIAVTTTCIKGGLFNYSKTRSQIEPTDSVLFTWTYMEEIKRLALTIFKLNLHFNTGILTLSDLQFPPPDSGYLWDAPVSKEFYRRYNAQLESGTVADDSPLICEIVRDVQPGRSGPAVLLGSDPWLGLVVQHARLTGLL